jgi:ABC-type lipoprotein export system ATPase subunit
MTKPPAVVLRGVKKAFPLRDGGILAVLDVADLSLSAGSCTVLRGRSGSGKTTLLNLIAGVTVPTAGTIRVGETDIFALPEARRDRFRAAHVGYVFQTFNLLSAFSALENVMLSMMFANAVPKREHRRRAAGLLAGLGLAGRLSHKPQHLSRGEQQRVAIARALANDPPLVLADEPGASLDATTAEDVLAALLTACREAQKTVLVVSHDDVIVGEADRVLEITEINRAADRHGPRRP